MPGKQLQKLNLRTFTEMKGTIMRRNLLPLAALLLFSPVLRATQTYAAKGLVLKADPAHKSLVVSCEKIPDFMEAMVMPFTVRNAEEIKSLRPGAMIEFSLVVSGDSSYIEKIHIHHYESVEQDPLGARRLKLMASVSEGGPAPKKLEVGAPVPDFTLTDQIGNPVSLSQLSGKVVAITFTYTQCALPNFCFRIANNFRRLQKRFSSRLGRDLIFLTITFDPAHDTQEVMAKYGKTWNADPQSWHLLTGKPSTVEDICNRFGISFWADEGLMTHSLHTVVVDRNGNLVTDLEGNEYTADQLGDLLQTTMDASPIRKLAQPSHIASR